MLGLDSVQGRCKFLLPSCCSFALLRASPRAAGPDTAVKQLLASIESLQQQQLLAEEARLDADEAERCANLEILALEEQLHAVLHQAASLDDQLQDAQLALELRLQERAVKEELLRCAPPEVPGGWGLGSPNWRWPAFVRTLLAALTGWAGASIKLAGCSRHARCLSGELQEADGAAGWAASGAWQAGPAL